MSRAVQVAIALAVAATVAGCALQTASSTSASGSTPPTPSVTHSGNGNRRAKRRAAAAAGPQLSLITEPLAGIAPLLTAIRGARRSVELVMYEDEDGRLDSALAADHARGVAVRVLLNGGYYGEGSSENDAAYRYLKGRGVAVRWTPSYYSLTHQKSLVVDGHAYILTFNLTPQYYASDRDFGIVDTQPADVAAIKQTFAADWAGTRISAPDGRDLIWSPGSETKLISLIDSARGLLDIYNEEMDSGPVEEALEAAARRGVDARVVMTYNSEWRSAFEALSAAGVRVRTYAADAPLYIHAKMILTAREAFIGSENFSYTSMQENRELGIVFSTPSLLDSLQTTFAGDYARAQPFR